MTEDMSLQQKAQFALESKQQGDLRYQWLVEKLMARLNVPQAHVEQMIFFLAMGAT